MSSMTMTLVSEQKSLLLGSFFKPELMSLVFAATYARPVVM